MLTLPVLRSPKQKMQQIITLRDFVNIKVKYTGIINHMHAVYMYLLPYVSDNFGRKSNVTTQPIHRLDPKNPIFQLGAQTKSNFSTQLSRLAAFDGSGRH